MEELHKAALAYYNNSSRELQLLAWNFFKAMDTNGDGRVSRGEFEDFLRHSGYGWLHYNSFAALDRNGDGSLDFWEVLTLYYMVKTRDVVCQTCGTCLTALYFTCVNCFDGHANNATTYDLCSDCYGRKKFSHHHTFFLDTYALLRSKRGTPSSSLQTCHHPHDHSPARPRIRWWDAFRALEIAITIGGLVSGASTCTIM